MQNRAFGKSLFVVVFSRIISLISSIVVGFVLPKILSVTDYGFYKVFTLYVAYTALLHLGFVDGILLKVSGMKYSDLNLQKMRTYTRFFATLEMFVFLVMLLVGVLVADGEYLFILVMLAVNMVFVNITTYYQFVSQAIQRFGEYSVKNIAISVIKTFFVLVLLLLTVGEVINVSYRVYLIGLNLLDFSIMIWYIAIYRDITFGKGVAIETVKGDIVMTL